MSPVISNKPASPDSDEIDLGRLVGELIDHKKLIIAVTSVFAILAIFYALFVTPIYQADALIQVEQKQRNSILSNLSQILPNSPPESAPEISLLKSRMILGKTVDDLTLQAQIEKKYFPLVGRGWARLTGQTQGQIKVSRFYVAKQDDKVPELTLTVEDNHHYQITGGHYHLQGETGQLLEAKGLALFVTELDAQADDKFSINYISRSEAISKLQQAFDAVDQGKDTGMLALTLTLTHPNPLLAQTILQDISSNYLEQNIARQAAQDTKSLQFLEQQLPQVRSQLDQSENRLSAYRKMSDPVDLNLQARSALDQIVNVDNQLNQLTFREAEVSQLYTKDHPTYIALMAKRKTLMQEKGKLNKQVSAMPATQQQVLKLSRDVESGRAVYMQLLNRQQELNIAKNSAIGNVRIIDDAVTAPNPVKPKKKLVILTGLVLGIFISVGLVLLRAFLRRGIESPEQLKELGISAYACVPVSEWMQKTSPKSIPGRKIKHKENLSFLALDNPADLSIEAIRGLRTSLHFAMMQARNNALMISGASPQVGKSFITNNLAGVLAQGDQKVLLIDADMRKGYAHKMFNLSLENGLSVILAGTATIQLGIKEVKAAGFDFIARGKMPPNPSELLMQNRFRLLLDWAGEHYDIVLVDTPPILAVTDAALIGHYAGTILLVARFEENTTQELEVSIKRFEQSGIQVKGCILNGIVKKAGSYYGYTHYGYSYDNNK